MGRKTYVLNLAKLMYYVLKLQINFEQKLLVIFYYENIVREDSLTSLVEAEVNAEYVWVISEAYLYYCIQSVEFAKIYLGQLDCYFYFY